MIIGLNGRKGVGKDTAGSHLVQQHGFKRASFAHLLKESAAHLFGVAPERWEEWKNDDTMEVLIQRNLSSEIGRARLAGETPPISIAHVRLTVRQFLQRYGTEAHRDVFGPNFWVDEAMKNIDPSVGDYVFTDARFPNELQAIKLEGGQTIQLIRKGERENNDTHVSEAPPPADLIDVIIETEEGDIAELHRALDWVISTNRSL